MKIERVTFTGADESVKHPEEILRVADDYPTVKTEWALLLSKSNEGRCPRYPSLTWMEHFLKQCGSYLTEGKMYCAGHIQGYWLRTMAEGKFALPTDRPTLWPYLNRIQLNFHGVKTEDAWRARLQQRDGFFTELYEKEFIIQMDGVNENLYHDAQELGITNLKPLFDLSAGRGIVPDVWPKPLHPLCNGYAGGLGPDTIKEQLKRLEDTVGDGLIWIDMESRIRSDSDLLFELDKCRKVLDVVAEGNYANS